MLLKRLGKIKDLVLLFNRIPQELDSELFFERESKSYARRSFCMRQNELALLLSGQAAGHAYAFAGQGFMHAFGINPGLDRICGWVYIMFPTSRRTGQLLNHEVEHFVLVVLGIKLHETKTATALQGFDYVFDKVVYVKTFIYFTIWNR
nr:hypothetical protein [uncultured Noviherbaspirillum sp.]